MQYLADRHTSKIKEKNSTYVAAYEVCFSIHPWTGRLLSEKVRGVMMVVREGGGGFCGIQRRRFKKEREREERGRRRSLIPFHGSEGIVNRGGGKEGRASSLTHTQERRFIYHGRGKKHHPQTERKRPILFLWFQNEQHPRKRGEGFDHSFQSP